MSAADILQRDSLSECGARQRLHKLLDPGSVRELLDPFQRLASPWLERQGIVAQSDDGVVAARGRLDGHEVVALAIEGAFLGGSLGEVSGAKIAGMLELAADANRDGRPTAALLLLETGGVRLQEANLGLAAIADIHAAIVDLRRYRPVIALSVGPVGCFGGMGIAAGLCSYLLLTREARLGLNGPAVIEQEAGTAEYDASDRPLIWSLSGGEQRHATGLADACCVDDLRAIRRQVQDWLRLGLPPRHRSERIDYYRARLAQLDAKAQADAGRARLALSLAQGDAIERGLS
ncbi:biotin-independent malonate decarboxylase subunit beta [Chromobacterium sp. Beijing]|uniref:biotin-independent malonate decarboxylase subunit beta n=1 Tax=Chromobacterium sp. Beijing TaxID=2735795 RepID=UPI001F3268F7|nr:biotin-independent malonate decarboxylase subunit beta [Chromobacterium sp. Beijing]UJB32172.1 biotin-independent malonate decarboxylase subunit beta [Chromobacterium sp. Beijing]